MKTSLAVVDPLERVDSHEVTSAMLAAALNGTLLVQRVVGHTTRDELGKE